HKTLYGHLSRIYVRRGQYVKQGQGIAQSGNSGLSSGPHLHFEIIQNGNTVNPRKYLR
nr:M23 family metallopeptidase [Spirochaetota bacterium]